MVVRAPLNGTVVPLQEVPDPVFAQTLVGPGVAIMPGPGRQTILAPISGRLLKLKPHAFIVAEGRTAILVHLGIDTVLLAGAASELVAYEKQMIRAGEPVMFWDPAQVAAAGLSAICPVVALDAALDEVFGIVQGLVVAGGDLFSWREKHG
ncbi:MAG TPA: phosphoenolpyruvate--carbohydrate phosphotransferase [Micromonosporaceae bacterium]|nr:phosphoenolpyruvate--carbohydrate phosphotransferase [Micromonosporaceae bacterium]